MRSNKNRSSQRVPPVPLELSARQVANQQGFKIQREIYRGSFYTKDQVRNLIYAGEFKGQPAVLKIYSDRRLTDEPRSLAAFNQRNKSRVVVAPRVFASHISSGHEGWMIVERLPAGGAFFTQPLPADQRAEFLEVYREYRKNFPQRATRPLTLPERLSASEFTSLRLARWLNLATEQEAAQVLAGQTSLLTSKDLERFQSGSDFVRRGFQNVPLVWCHGHFKPHEIYKTADGRYYLIDFAHTHLFPQGYEFGFLVWADQLMSLTRKTTAASLLKNIQAWQTLFVPVARELGWKNFSRLATVNLVERLLGTVMADIAASDRPRLEKRWKIDLLWKVFDQLME